jgi:dUTP pyrophosphatase
MKVSIINRSHHALPSYQTAGAAALDITANLTEPVTLGSLERAVVPTGLFIAVPNGFEAQVRSRSGLAAKHGIAVLNSPGTIDSDYRGELMVILVNHSRDAYTLRDGDRVAQVIIFPIQRIEWEEVQSHDETARGAGGLGHSGR